MGNGLTRYERWRLYRMPYEYVAEFDMHDTAHCKRFYRSVRCKRHSIPYRPAWLAVASFLGALLLFIVVMGFVVWISLYHE